jgi:hypothetical protein
MSANNGGPAFPHQPALNANGEHIMYGSTGMTVRQVYKAAVMQAICTPTVKDGSPNNWNWAMLIRQASKAADALLAEDEEHTKK